MSADAAYAQAVATVDELTTQLDEAVRGITDGVNQALALPLLPPQLVEPIRDAFAQLAAKVSEVFEQVRRLVTERGSPDALRDAAQSWTTQVGAAASTRAGLLTKESLETDDRWTGSAADRYAQAVTGQGRALNEVKTETDLLSTVLNEVASALKAFWVAIAVALGSYVALMIGCIVGACTGVGTVPSLLAALGFSVAFLGAVATADAVFENALDEKKAKMQQVGAAGGNFAGDRWPRAVADQLTDATTGDGDPSDWTPR